MRKTYKTFITSCQGYVIIKRNTSQINLHTFTFIKETMVNILMANCKISGSANYNVSLKFPLKA
ncbi:MAG: hypothetical protein PWQ25_2041 [Deferribacteres bacterium]|jgi:ABC-type sulfate transport system substrate-binding protein|nr:hypothetical protein [Deferribacteres bacterium]